MAHVGSTIDLPQQATSSRPSGFWLAVITAAVVLMIGAAAVLQLNNGTSAGTVAGDRSYDQVESLRGGAPLTLDRSYDKAEGIKGGAKSGTVRAPIVNIAPATNEFKHAPGRGPLQ